ncbi:MAG: hypothetical protein HC831_07585 [Chloroflexia bacterium]|nr:hypothetical protein [Chloroflexia bacterium]
MVIVYDMTNKIIYNKLILIFQELTVLELNFFFIFATNLTRITKCEVPYIGRFSKLWKDFKINKINKRMKLAIKVVLLAAIVALGYFIYQSIDEPIKFERNKKKDTMRLFNVLKILGLQNWLI